VPDPEESPLVALPPAPVAVVDAAEDVEAAVLVTLADPASPPEPNADAPGP
jgi:hypothetical protein